MQPQPLALFDQQEVSAFWKSAVKKADSTFVRMLTDLQTLPLARFYS